MLRGPADDEVVDWLRLIRSHNVGPATFLSLLSRFGDAKEALAALPALTQKVGGRAPIAIASRDSVLREMDRAARMGAHHVFLGTPDYPPRLAAIHAPPPVVMVRGDARLMSRRAIGVVGARKASAAGKTMAHRLSEAFGEAGFVVVSGLALGIDGAAHSAAIETGTIAVVAGGVDRPTPDAHLDLADEIAGKGALISEMPLGLNPAARDFPRRNRLIAGLVEAVVVVEAAARSGSLHTARYALDENREVFAVPGSPLDPRAAGCLSLLRDGAHLAVSAEDVLAVVDGAPHAPALPGLAEEEAPFHVSVDDANTRVLDALSLVPVSVDDVVHATGLSAGVVMASLVELDLAGLVEHEEDGSVRTALS